MESPMSKLSNLIRKRTFKKVLIVYILFNLGILFSFYGSILYSPSIIPETDELTPDGARMEVINLTKGALIAQNFEINQYNIGFDMINIGGIFLIVGLLYYNYIEATESVNLSKKRLLKVYKLRQKGTLQGNILEWLCLVVFSFSFFTFLYNIFVYIIIISFIIGVVGFTIRKFQIFEIGPNASYA